MSLQPLSFYKKPGFEVWLLQCALLGSGVAPGASRMPQPLWDTDVGTSLPVLL